MKKYLVFAELESYENKMYVVLQKEKRIIIKNIIVKTKK